MLSGYTMCQHSIFGNYISTQPQCEHNPDQNSNATMFRLVFSSLIKSAYSVSLPLRLSSRLPGEEPRQPPHGHHPARPLVQEQVHQADLPGRRRHGETNNFRPLLCMNTRDTNHFHLLVLWRWRCCCLQVIMSLVTFASLQLFSSQYRPLLMSQPSSHSAVSSLFPLSFPLTSVSVWLSAAQHSCSQGNQRPLATCGHSETLCVFSWCEVNPPLPLNSSFYLTGVRFVVAETRVKSVFIW